MRDRIEWDGAPVTMTANEAIHASAGSGDSALNKAKDFLREYLADRPMSSEQVTEAAKAHSISESTLRRARKDLKIVSEKDEYQGAWMMRLP